MYTNSRSLDVLRGVDYLIGVCRLVLLVERVSASLQIGRSSE